MKLLSTGTATGDTLLGIYTVVLFCVLMLAWECLFGRKKRRHEHKE